MSKKVTITLFLLLLFAPALLWGVQRITGAEVDVPLAGFTDAVEWPILSLQTLADGSFQSTSAEYIETAIPLRGVYTRNYNTLQYYGFRLGNCTLGRHHSVFGSGYLEEYCILGDNFDLTLPENTAGLEDTVAHMVSANQKLEAFGKHLYIYLVPGKPELYPEDVPAKYLPMGNPDDTTALEAMTALLENTDIPFLPCAELADGLEYPAYYPSGIHWSRTFEQIVHQRLISDFSALTGKAYKNLEFTGVEARNAPFWRDADGHSLLNIWSAPAGPYYQYETAVATPPHTQPLRITLWGDSFSDGFLFDLSGGDFAENTVIHINRDNCAQYSLNAEQSLLEHDWANLDWQRCLDLSDIIVLEMVAHEITNHTYGFVQALDAYLDAYVPQKMSSYYPTAWDASDPAKASNAFASGLWGLESGFSWTNAECKISLNDEMSSQKGLEVVYAVPQFDGGNTITVTVNDKVISKKTYSEGVTDTLVFSPEILPDAQDGIYYVEIFCSKTMNPKQMGLSDDTRDLGITLMYVGGAR